MEKIIRKSKIHTYDVVVLAGNSKELQEFTKSLIDNLALQFNMGKIKFMGLKNKKKRNRTCLLLE